MAGGGGEAKKKFFSAAGDRTNKEGGPDTDPYYTYVLRTTTTTAPNVWTGGGAICSICRRSRFRNVILRRISCEDSRIGEKRLKGRSSLSLSLCTMCLICAHIGSFCSQIKRMLPPSAVRLPRAEEQGDICCLANINMQKLNTKKRKEGERRG